MTNPQIDRLLALSERATKGPWVANFVQPTPYSRIETDAGGYPNDGWVIANELLGPDGPANAAFIVAAVNFVRNDLPTLLAERDAASARARSLEEALTPSADTKAAYIGEFHMGITLRHRGQEDYRRVPIEWTTIKEIMAAIRERARLARGEG